MKKQLFTCFTIALLSWTISPSYSQSADRLIYSDDELIFPSGKIPITKDSLKTIPSEIKKAVKSFTRDYKNITNAKWLRLNHGFSVVYFTVDSINTRLLYNKKGYCENIIRYYFENRLPPAIRHLVKTTYYDFSIYHIIEPTINGVTSYLIQMEGKTSWKTIKVVDGEMEVLEELLKVK
jgi:hypothetical protein